MRTLTPWLAKAALSAIYWLGCFYVAVGLFFGDRVEPNGAIVAPMPVMPPWLYALLAILLYAVLSWAWDHLIAGRST